MQYKERNLMGPGENNSECSSLRGKDPRVQQSNKELLRGKLWGVIMKCGEYDELHLKYSWQVAEFCKAVKEVDLDLVRLRL